MPGNLDIVITPSKQFATSNDELTVPKLNLLGSPTGTVSGNLSQIADVSADAAADGQPLVWDDGNSEWTPGLVNVAYIGVGNPNATYFLRGDGQWADPATTSSAEKLFQNWNHY